VQKDSRGAGKRANAPSFLSSSLKFSLSKSMLSLRNQARDYQHHKVQQDNTHGHSHPHTPKPSPLTTKITQKQNSPVHFRHKSALFIEVTPKPDSIVTSLISAAEDESEHTRNFGSCASVRFSQQPTKSSPQVEASESTGTTEGGGGAYRHAFLRFFKRLLVVLNKVSEFGCSRKERLPAR